MPNHYPGHLPFWWICSAQENDLVPFSVNVSHRSIFFEIKPPLKCQLDENGKVTEANIILLDNIEISLKKLLEERYNIKFSDMNFIEVHHDKGNLLRGIDNKTEMGLQFVNIRMFFSQ